MPRMKCIAAAVAVVLSAVAAAGQQARRVEEPSWAPKALEAAKFPPGHKAHTKLAEVRAKHKGAASWREVVVNDDHLNAVYVASSAGSKVTRRFHPDTREWWVVLEGQIRFEIEGQAPFVATRGSMVQVPMQTIYAMETVGEQPALRFEVNIARAKTLYPKDVEPPKLEGHRWIPVVLGRTPGPYDRGNQPHINLYELAKAPGYKGGRFVHDDRAVSNIIYGHEKDLPPLNPNDKGHYHPECAEFWLIMAGKIRYPIENVGVVIAEEGDVVYAPIMTFHAPRFYGEGPSCRLAMNGYPNIAHLRDAPPPH